MRSPDDPLHLLFRKEAESLSAEVAATGESPAPERVESLTRLAKLVELRAAAKPSKGRNWRPAAALAATLLLVTLLLFARVSSTDIELAVETSEAQFVLAGEQVLTSDLVLPGVGISGVAEIQLPRDAHHEARTFAAGKDAAGAIRLSPASDSKRPGTVTLASLTPPDRTRVTIRAGDAQHGYRLSLGGARFDFRAGLEGSVTASVPGSGPVTLDLHAPSPVLLRAGTEETSIDFALPPGNGKVFSPQLEVGGLAFQTIDESHGTGQTLLRRVSTILSGTLYLESLDGAERRLRPGESLQFGESRGIIRALKLGDDRVGVQFHGAVKGMTTGIGEGHRSLMPTYLEWLRARHGLLLLWGSVLYLFGLLNRALSWWGSGK